MENHTTDKSSSYFLIRRRGQDWSSPQPMYGRSWENVVKDWRGNILRKAIEGPFPITLKHYRRGVCVAVETLGVVL